MQELRLGLLRLDCELPDYFLIKAAMHRGQTLPSQSVRTVNGDLALRITIPTSKNAHLRLRRRCAAAIPWLDPMYVPVPLIALAIER